MHSEGTGKVDPCGSFWWQYLLSVLGLEFVEDGLLFYLLNGYKFFETICNGGEGLRRRRTKGAHSGMILFGELFDVLNCEKLRHSLLFSTT